MMAATTQRRGQSAPGSTGVSDTHFVTEACLYLTENDKYFKIGFGNNDCDTFLLRGSQHTRDPGDGVVAPGRLTSRQAVANQGPGISRL